MDTAIQIARQTGARLLEHFQSAELTANLKSDQSIVTNADLEADQYISNALQEKFPQDLILSEEFQTTLPLSHHNQALWIVDPLDGTTNFSLGLQIWGVLLTQILHGHPVLAVLYFPMINELYSVQRGQGAYLNGSLIQVKPPRKEYPLPFFACCSRTFKRYDIQVPYKPRILGSAAYSMCCVARGVAVLGFDASPKIWDIAGAWLLIQEAGGEIELFDRSDPFPLQPGIDYAQLNLTTIAAPNNQLIAKARTQILPKSSA